MTIVAIKKKQQHTSQIISKQDVSRSVLGPRKSRQRKPATQQSCKKTDSNDEDAGSETGETRIVAPFISCHLHLYLLYLITEKQEWVEDANVMHASWEKKSISSALEPSNSFLVLSCAALIITISVTIVVFLSVSC